MASGNMIIPLDSGVFAYEATEALKALLIGIYDELGVETNIMMFLLRGHSALSFGRAATREIEKLLRGFLAANDIDFLRIIKVPFSIKIHRAQMRGMPISHSAPHSRVGRVYQRIAREMIVSE